MSDPFTGEFADVLTALETTHVPAHSTELEGAVAAALAKPPAPERVNGIEAAIARDADEAWSLAMAFLADEDAAWQSVVAGFVRLGKGECVAISQADSLRAQAEAALEVARLLAKGGHQPEVCGASLPVEARLGILLQGGLGHTGLELEDAPDPSAALLAAYPRPGRESGDELCRLLVRELLGLLERGEAADLEALRAEHPTVATLMRERYAEVAEVPLLVLPNTEELIASVLQQQASESAHHARVGAVRLRVTVTCSFCHDGLGREEAVFCSGCLAPHHEECFRMHGECSAPGCGQTQIVRPGEPIKIVPKPPRRRRLWPLALAMVLGGGAVAAFNHLPEFAADEPEVFEFVEESQPSVALDPAVLKEAKARTEKAEAERAAARKQREGIAAILNSKQISLNFDETPFDEAIDFLRDITQLNYVISSDAQDVIENEQVEVSLRLRNISLRNALNLILASNESLAYRIEQGVIKIHTQDDFYEELILEVYDIEGIVSGATKAQGGFQVDPDQLIALLETIYGEDDEEGSVEFTSSTLIVRKTASAHHKTRRLLDYLRGSYKPEKPTTPAWVLELEKKLDQTVTLNMPETPMAEVVSYIQDLTKANLVLGSAVDGQETTVSLRLRDVPLRDALKIILEQTGLGMTYKDQVIYITQPEDARGEYTLRIVHTADIEGWMEAESLEQVVVNAVGEDNWDDPASIECHHQQLIIHQTESMHEAIDNVLAKLRISRARNRVKAD